MGFKDAFNFIYNHVKDYYFKHYGKDRKVMYADILDYISGQLSASGTTDLEWVKKNWGAVYIDGEILDEIWEYCQKKIHQEKKAYAHSFKI